MRFAGALWTLLACAPMASFAKTRLLAIMPMSESFQTAIQGMQSELGREYELILFDVEARESKDILLGIYRNATPQALVLMDSKAVSLVKDLQKRDSLFARTPKFVLMTLKVEDAIHGLSRVAGIRFEIPAYTIFTNLHILSSRDFRRIGVFHRRSFSPFIEESRKFLAKEKMELLAKCLDCQGASGEAPPSSKAILQEMKKGMAQLQDENAEVVWMLADNVFVNETTLRKFWVKLVRESRLPLVVPLAHFAGLEMNLGLFSVYPDYFQLGVQSAQQVIQVFESGESVEDLGLEPLLSVQTTLNVDLAAKIRWGLREEKFGRVKNVLRKN